MMAGASIGALLSTKTLPIPPAPPRRPAASLTALLGQRLRQLRTQRSYESLADELAASLLKPLKVALAELLGIVPEADALGADTEARSDSFKLPDMGGVLAEAHANGSDPLLHEMVPNTVWEPGSARAPIIPSMIARALLFDSVMLHKDQNFRRRFDGVFGAGSSDRVLQGAA